MTDNTMPPPALHQPSLIRHARLLADSYTRVTGRHLLDSDTRDDHTLAEALFYAPFVLLSHDSRADPVFNYGNHRALTLFELDWDNFVQLPSRHSAEPLEQSERARLLEKVSHEGYIDDYRGIRVSRSGKRFWIEQATVWNIMDEEERYKGQAATFMNWTPIADTENQGERHD